MAEKSILKINGDHIVSLLLCYFSPQHSRTPALVTIDFLTVSFPGGLPLPSPHGRGPDGAQCEYGDGRVSETGV